MTAWQPGMRITAARLNDGVDPVVATTGMTGQSGLSVTVNTNVTRTVSTTVSTFTGSRSGKIVTLDFVLALTVKDTTGASSNIPQITSGNMPDWLMATSPAGWRPTIGTIDGFWDNGTASGGFVIGIDGKCTMRTINNAVLSDGTNITCHTAFILV